MEAVIKNIQTRIAKLKAKIDQHEALLKMLQDVCDHEYTDGTTAMQYHGHNKNYSECAICGKGVWE